MSSDQAKGQLVQFLQKFIPGTELTEAALLVDNLEQAAFCEGQVANDLAWRKGVDDKWIRRMEVPA